MLERKDVVDFCSRLISTNSVSGNEEKVASIIQDKMRELGYDEVGTDELGSVYGIIRGGIPKTIMFEGHMDTVDVSAANLVQTFLCKNHRNFAVMCKLLCFFKRYLTAYKDYCRKIQHLCCSYNLYVCKSCKKK